MSLPSRSALLAQIQSLKKRKPANWRKRAHALCEALGDLDGIPKPLPVNAKTARKSYFSGKGALVSQAFFERMQTDVHDDGVHREYQTAMEGGHMVPTVAPELAVIDTRNAWSEPDEAPAAVNPFAGAADTLYKILEYLIASSLKFTSVHAVGLRGIALVQSIAPSLLGGITDSDLAKQLGVTKQALSKHRAELAHIAPSFERGQGFQSQARREVCRARAIRQHKRARHFMHGNRAA
jgi:hypothetical protein